MYTYMSLNLYVKLIPFYVILYFIKASRKNCSISTWHVIIIIEVHVKCPQCIYFDLKQPWCHLFRFMYMYRSNISTYIYCFYSDPELMYVPPEYENIGNSYKVTEHNLSFIDICYRHFRSSITHEIHSE